MIADAERTVLISSMGRVDPGTLWAFDVSTGSVHRIALGSDAKSLVPNVGTEGFFSVAHHFDGRRFEVSVHAFSDPARVLGRATVTESGRELTGESNAWACVPRLYVAYVTLGALHDYSLFKIDHVRRAVDVQRLDWYDDRFDKGYQGVVSVTEAAGEALAVFSVQRSSELVLHDLQSGQQRGVVHLAGRRGGTPRVWFRTGASEVWASDYDTIVKLDRSSWRVKDVRRLQRAFAFVGIQQFIGDFAFDPDETVCAVARPFSGDVVALDPATMKIRWRADVGRQPLEVAVLRDRAVIARDWKTGDTLRGVLQPSRS